MRSVRRVCVFCGSSRGTAAAYAAAAHELGTALAARGDGVVYGGGHVGLMGVVADAALAAGARVVGVIPSTLMERELGHRALHELHVVETMHERKQMMAERADAFLALPGGIGTFEELFEVWTWRQLGYHDKPVGLLNVEGYYDTLLDFLGQTERHGFVNEAQRALLQVDSEPEALLQRLEALARLATAPDDYRRI